MTFRKLPGRRAAMSVSITVIVTLIIGAFPLLVKSGWEVRKSYAVEIPSYRHAQILIPCPGGVQVNTWNGNLFYPVSLAHTPGLGAPLDLVLSYNSSCHETNGRFGCGWQLNYNIYYIREDNGDITFYWGDGSSVTFENSGGIYAAPPITQLHLEIDEYEPSEFIIERQDGLKYYFESPIHKHVTRIEDANGNLTTFQYDSEGYLDYIKDASGRFLYLYFWNGRLSSITDYHTGNIRIRSIDYDEDGNLEAIRFSTDFEYTYSYDADHYLTGITNPLGYETSISYVDGAASSVAGPETEIEFDFRSDGSTAISQGPNHTSVITYDEHGRAVTVADPLGNTSEITWDDQNSITAIVDPEGNQMSYTYDTDGNLTSVTNAAGATLSLTYESGTDRISGISTPGGYTINYDYDENGNLILATDPLGITTFQYDSQGKLVSSNGPDGSAVDYQYDANGYLVSCLDNSLTYDNAGRITSWSNSKSTLNYTHDKWDRLLTVEYATLGRAIGYTYDAVGNRASMNDPGGGTYSYEYDGAGRLTSMTNSLDETTTYLYDDVGRLIQTAYANGETTIYEWDDTHHLKSLISRRPDGEERSRIEYEYDRTDNRTRVIENLTDTTDYEYDAVGRLIAVSKQDGSTISYGYDNMGNRISMIDQSGATVYGYDESDRLLTAGDVTFGWDQYGQLRNRTVNGETWLYDYDLYGRLTGITYPDGKSSGFTYYPNGYRLGRADTSGEVSLYLYDGPNIILETDEFGSTTDRYTCGLGVDEWISSSHDGASYFYHRDGVQSVRSLSDSSGETVATYSYSEFGKLIEMSGDSNNRYLFAGREYDKENGLYYNRARYYDPTTGRFQCPDALRFSDGYNPYVYASNNPVGRIDPMGMFNYLVLFEDRYWFQGVEYVRYYYDWVQGLSSLAALPASARVITSLASAKAIAATLLVVAVIGEIVYIGDLSSDIITANIARRQLEKTIPQIQNVTGPHGGSHGSPPESPPGEDDGSTGGSGSGSGIESGPLNRPASSYLDPDRLATGFPSVNYVTVDSRPKQTEWDAEAERYPKESSDKTIDRYTSSWYRLNNRRFNLFTPKTEMSITESAIDLAALLPETGPSGTTPVATVPNDVLGGNTNAIDALACDYVNDESGEIKATVLVVKSLAGAYDHDYSVCNRFHGYTIQAVDQIPMFGRNDSAAQFQYISMSNGSSTQEAIVFAAYVNDSAEHFQIDSRWLRNFYYTDSTLTDLDYVLSFEVFGISAVDCYNLTRRIIADEMAVMGSVAFENWRDPENPPLIMRSAKVNGDVVEIELFSWLATGQEAHFHGTYRSHTDVSENIPFDIPVMVEPGPNSVILPLGNILDAVIEMGLAGGDYLIDRVYVGSGFWFDFDDAANGGTSNIVLELPPCPASEGFVAGDMVLSGCAGFTGQVGSHGWAGIGRTFNPNGIPVDVSHHQALSFRASGDGKTYRVLLETDAVTDGDFHQCIFTPEPYPGQQLIPLQSFEQLGFGQPEPFTGEDVRSVIWQTVGEPLDAVALNIENLGFFNSTVISNTSVFLNTSDVAGPYQITTTIQDDIMVQSAALVFATGDEPTTWDSVTMTDLGDGLYGASIPGQALDTRVRYYITAVDNIGNTATDPVDAPYSTYQFQVSERPDLWIDDFSDTDPRNMLGGYAGLFASDSMGLIVQRYDKQSVQLEYDVSGPGQWGAYATFLGGLDLRPYRSLNFRVKGQAGHEKIRVGIGDTLQNEPKTTIDQWLPSGITGDWQNISIPLCAFTSVTDRSCVDRVVFGMEDAIGSGLGNIQVDDIKISQVPIVPVVIDNFDGQTDFNALGGVRWTSMSGGAAIEGGFEQDSVHGQNGFNYRITYSGVSADDWATWGNSLMGLDVTDYDTLGFYLKAAAGKPLPNLYLTDALNREYVHLDDYSTPDDTWQRLAIPLSDFASQGIDLSSLHCLELAFEWQVMSGTVYVDDLKFSLGPSSSLSMSGIVSYCSDPSKLISDVIVNVTTAPSVIDTTNDYGEYTLVISPPGASKICASRNETDVFSSDGLTVSDIIKIRRHLAMLETFDDPCKLIASDVTCDSLVSISDVIKIRRCLVRIEPLPCGSWKFIDADYPLTLDNWHTALECIDTVSTLSELTAIDFVGIKLGDVNNTWVAPALTASIANSNSTFSEPAEVRLTNSAGNIGDTAEFNIEILNADSVAGIEIHFSYIPQHIAFVGVNSSVLSDCTLNDTDGDFHLVWDDFENPIDASNPVVIASLQYEILPDMIDSTELMLYNIEIADPNGNPYSINLNNGWIVYRNQTDVQAPEEQGLIPDHYFLDQNHPNPFNPETQISFGLPKASNVRLDIYNILCRKVGTVIDQHLDAGIHSVRWDGSSMASGVYFYQIKAGDFVASKKMLLLK